MIVGTHGNNLIPLEQAVERYGISSGDILEAKELYPELAEFVGGNTFVKLYRFGALRTISIKSMPEQGYRSSEEFEENLQGSFESSNIGRLVEDPGKVMVSELYSYLMRCKHNSVLQGSKHIIKGYELHE